jgi:hypothetical protein
VRGGDDHWLPPERGSHRDQHTLGNVYTEMLMQICMDYPSLPDPRTLRLSEIRFFYEGLRGALKRRTNPHPQKH